MRIFTKLRKLPSQIYLLSGILLFVFVFPLIDKLEGFDFIGPFAYSLMILSTLSVITIKKGKKTNYLFGLIAMSVLMIWVMYFSDKAFVKYLSFIFSISVFAIAVIMMINQVVKSENVNLRVILEAIIGYLLIGVMFTLTNTIISAIQPSSFNIPDPHIADYVYYSFITLTTIGYGDITPDTDFAKLSSIFFGLCGQLYLTIIMAVIIGMFLKRK